MKMRIKTTRGQSGTSEELEAVKGRLGNYDANRKDLELKIRELKYELNYQTKEFETAGKHLDEDYQKLAESNEVKIEALSAKLAELTEFLDNQKDSFFNWLSEHKRWEQTIGQVCDERLLYGKEFTAEVAREIPFMESASPPGFTGMSRPRRITWRRRRMPRKNVPESSASSLRRGRIWRRQGESPQAISILREAHQGGYLSCGI